VSDSLKGGVLNAPDNLIYGFGPFLLEPHARRLSRHGESVPLAAPEFELLLLLVRNRGRVVEKREIMATVWPDAEVEENNLTVRMSSLRRALGERKGYHPYIQTVAGRGYCLVTQAKELHAQPGTGTPETVANTQGVPGAAVRLGGEPEAGDEQPVPSGSAVARRSGGGVLLAAARRKWEIRGLRLYALLLVGLLATSLFYGVLGRQRGGESQAPAQSMRMSRATQTGRVAWAAVSPDGQNIAYVERDGELHSLWLQRAGTNNPLQLLPPAKLTYKDPSFSRDGNTLYYSKCQPGCQLNRMPILGGVETALPVRADSPVTFSPDGRRMAYVWVAVAGTSTEVSLMVSNADGTGEEALNSRRGGIAYQGGAPAWSPDGKVIALPILVGEGEQTHMKVIGVGVADRAESTLTSQRWRFIKDVAWLPDGGGLVINGRDEASAPELAMQIWRVPLTGGEARRISNDLNNYWRIGISADGSTLMALQLQSTSGLWIAPAEDPSAAAQVTRGTLDRHDGNLGLSVTPDGRLIYVSDLSGKRDLWSINADGSGLRQLTDGSHKDFFPAMTPDGRYVVFESTRDGAHGIWRADADGRNPARLTRGPYDSEPACSPDGKWVVYVSDDGGLPKLRKVPVEGGEPVPLTDEFAQHPAFSPDGKVIAYYRMDKQRRERRDIVFIPAQGGAPIKTLPAPKNFGSVMRWSPAGDSLSYRDNTLTGLWRLPLDGTPPGPLMNLRGQRLLTFCYSQDGRRLAYAGGPNLSDVILITRFN
jgi:Tol biopolymer transport system component/DNA-binding winged helix-turn-helix (wHTH) protein